MGRAIEDHEVLTPFGQVSDTLIRGEGVMDLGKEEGGFMSLTVRFANEPTLGYEPESYEDLERRTWAKFDLTTELDDLTEEGMSEGDAKEIVDVAERIIKILRKVRKTGHPYV